MVPAPAPPNEEHTSLTLPAEARYIATLRIHVGALVTEIDPERAEDLKVVITELATEGIEGGRRGGSWHVSSWEDEDRLWIEFRTPRPSGEAVSPHRTQLLRALIPDAEYLAGGQEERLVRIPVDR